MTTLTWRLPNIRPRFVARGAAVHWKVIPDKAYGKAWAVCVPVALEGGNWTLKLAAPAAPVGTTPAQTERWTEVVPEPSGAGADHVILLLGYDQAPGGGGGNVVVNAFSQVAPGVLQDVVTALEAAMGQQGLRARLLPAATPVSPAPISPVRTAMSLARASQHPAADASPDPGALPAAFLRLAFASCQYPAGLLDKVPAQQSYDRLATLLETPGSAPPSVLLLLGDQVYVDATAGLLDPMRIDDRYRVPYEELQNVESLQRVLEAPIRVEWMLDDHEIEDNWEPRTPGVTGPLYGKGVAAYWAHQRAESVALPDAWSAFPPSNGWALFMADTRTQREHRNDATLSSAQILGAKQKAALEQWLLAVPPEDLKLIASPAMLLPRLVEHCDEPLHLDCWQGYPASMHGLLAFLCDHQIPNVHFLSGDAHLGCDVRITVTGPNARTVNTRSTHSAALYAPLPFANEQPWNLKLANDSFRFPDPLTGPYTCTVNGGLLQPAGDGCCLLTAVRANGSWTVTTITI